MQPYNNVMKGRNNMKKIWIALVVVAMLALLCTLGMITVSAEEGEQAACAHEKSVQALYNNDEHWTVCASCGVEISRQAHEFKLGKLDDGRHAIACECGRVLPDSVEAHDWVLVQGEDSHLSCAVCNATTDSCVYDQVTYYNDAYHTYACLCGQVNSELEAHVVDMTELQHNDEAHWHGCPCGYGARDVSEHTWSEAWVTNTTHHWKECADCGEKKDLTAHSGGTATCQVDAECAECGSSYEADTYTHVSDAWVYSWNNTHHSATYACCGEVAVALESHNWDNGVCADCGYECNHDVVINGAVFNYVSTGNDKHIVVCRNCRVQEEKNCHGGEATCIAKAVCDDCKAEYGEKDPTNHVGAVTWAGDGTKHWKVCTTEGESTGCGSIVEGTTADHNWSDGQCSDCQYTCTHPDASKKLTPDDEKTHHEFCDICKKVLQSALTHTWDADGKCTGCQYQCAHQADEQNTWMNWSNENNAHKYTCEKCGWQDETKEGNCAGGTATCVAKAKCETCKLEYGNVDSQNHVDKTWVIEADGHSAICDTTKNGCGATLEAKEVHVWAEGVCSNENCQYACPHNGTQTTEVNTDTDTHDVTCDICQKLRVNDGAHDWVVDDSDNTKNKCQVCDTVCDHMSGEDSLKVFTNANDEGTWKHKATCSRCGHVDQQGACAVGENGAEATCVAAAVCETCKLAFGNINADNHLWDATTGECVREGCDFICQHENVSETDDGDENNQNNQHTTTCTTCGYVAKADCYGNEGTATCSVKAVCAGCGQGYGALDPEKHDKQLCLAKLEITQIPITNDGYETHHYVQYPCQQNEDGDAVLVKEGHDWNNGICSKCDYICTSPNLIVIDDKEDNGKHQKQCATCGHIVEVVCSGGQATCLQRAVCKDCNAEYGDFGENHDEACVRTVGIIPNNPSQHNVYYTCKKDEDGNSEPTLENHNIDPTKGECECGWHVTVTTGQETATVNEQKEQPVNEE